MKNTVKQSEIGNYCHERVKRLSHFKLLKIEREDIPKISAILASTLQDVLTRDGLEIGLHMEMEEDIMDFNTGEFKDGK